MKTSYGEPTRSLEAEYIQKQREEAQDQYNKTCNRVDESLNKMPPGTEGKGDLSKKPHLAYLDPFLEYEMGMGMRYGANKHGWNNHRKMGPEAAQFIVDSLKRHFNAFLRGEEVDEESQTSHLACLINNANFLYRLSRIHGYDEVLNNIFGETK